MKSLVAIILALALGGCATCHEHPVACGVVTAITVGAVAAAAQHHHDQRAQSGPTSAVVLGQCVPGPLPNGTCIP